YYHIEQSNLPSWGLFWHGQFDGASVDYLLFAIAGTPPEHGADQHQAQADDRNRHQLANIWKHEAANTHEATAYDDQKRGYDNCQDRWRKVDWHCNPMWLAIVAFAFGSGNKTSLAAQGAAPAPQTKNRKARRN